ncbi:hypothetical protein D3C86_1556620 [compost metagenome]
MKTTLVLAASAALVMSSFVAAPTAMAHPTTIEVDGSYCGFNANQIANGFYCLATFDTDECHEVVTVTFRSYNHRGNFMVGRTEVVNIEDTEWGHHHDDDHHHECHA